MKKYVIVTDTGTDLTENMCEALELQVVQLGVNVDGVDVKVSTEAEIKAIYTKLREKKSATTSAINIDEFTGVFEAFAEKGIDVLYLGFSSGLSGTFSAAAVAMRELSEKYPDGKLYAVDTLCASMGQGLLVYYAAKMKQNGADIETVRDFVEANKLRLCHWFTVDDLFFLKRGGRVSAATAAVGTMLSIKPVLHMDNAGKLINVSKVRGRKAAVDALFEKAKNCAAPGENDVMFISRGECIEDAEYLAGRLKNELGIRQVEVNYIGPVIGSHSGPGTLAVFYLGNER